MGDFVHNVVARGAGLPVALPVEPGPRAPLPGIADPGALAHEGGHQEIPRPAELRVDEDSSAPAAALPPTASHEASAPAPTARAERGTSGDAGAESQPRCRQPRRRLTQRRWRTRSRCWTGRRCWTRRRPRRAVRPRSRLRRLLPAPRSRSNPSRQAPSSSPSVRRRDHPASSREPPPVPDLEAGPAATRATPEVEPAPPPRGRPAARAEPAQEPLSEPPPSRSRRRPGRCPGPPPTPARRRRSAEASVRSGPVEPAPTPSLHAPTREPRDARPTEPLRPAVAAPRPPEPAERPTAPAEAPRILEPRPEPAPPARARPPAAAKPAEPARRRDARQGPGAGRPARSRRSA